MCYIGGASPNRTEYVCPVCGTKTLYTKEDEKKFFSKDPMVVNIGTYRWQCNMLRELGWDVNLDESLLRSVCCKPEERKRLFLEITLDGKTTRSELRNGDLTMLLAFAENKLAWMSNDQLELPLQPELLRLCELLGVDEDLEILIERVELEEKLKEKREKAVTFRIRKWLSAKAANFSAARTPDEIDMTPKASPSKTIELPKSPSSFTIPVLVILIAAFGARAYWLFKNRMK